MTPAHQQGPRAAGSLLGFFPGTPPGAPSFEKFRFCPAGLPGLVPPRRWSSGPVKRPERGAPAQFSSAHFGRSVVPDTLKTLFGGPLRVCLKMVFHGCQTRPVWAWAVIWMSRAFPFSGITSW